MVNTVTDVTESSRYEITVDGERAGIAEYRDASGARTFTHTKVEERFEGRGLAKQLVSFALDDTRAKGLRVVPKCSYVKGFIERNPGYADLVR